MSVEVRRHILFRAFQTWELLVFLVAFGAGVFALSNAGLVALSDYAHPVYYVSGLAFTVLWGALIGAFGLYNSRRLVSRANEYLSAIAVVGITAGALALAGAFLNLPTNAASFLGPFIVAGSALMVVGRLIARGILRAARARGRNLRFITVVGASLPAQRLVQRLLEDDMSGYRVNAIFDAPAMLKTCRTDLGPCRNIEDLGAHLMRDPVDEVLIALPLSTHYNQVLDIAAQCRRVGVTARTLWTDTNGRAPIPATVEQVADHHTTLVFPNTPSWGWRGKAKAVLDVVIASLALVVLSPLFLIVAVLIKRDSPGPVFFTQLRTGRNKQPFRFYKFRTMVQDAERQQAALEQHNEAGGPVFKIKQDPRVTRLGQFLRRTSIDELPQLINVVIGDMSLVGPRPLPFRDVERFEEDWHSRRFSVKPGLTCSWVLAGRSELDFDAWVRLDLDYIDNWSLRRDFGICLRTIPALLRGSGAY